MPTQRPTVLGQTLKDERRESLEIFTKVFGPTRPKGHNDLGLSRKHIMEPINGSLRRLQTDYVDLYQAHRYDFETPLEETMQAFADIVRQGNALYIGVSEWTADQIRDGHARAKDLGFQLISNQPQYSILWRVIEAEVIPTSAELGLSPDRGPETQADREAGLAMAQLSIAWVLQNENVASAIIGASRPEQIAANVAGFAQMLDWRIWL